MDLDDFPPMLFLESPLGFDVPGWIYEIKHDGYRITAMFGSGKCRLRTRAGADCTDWFPEIARSLATVVGGPHITDGELCVFDDRGRSDYDRLQVRARRRRWFEGADPVGYAVFDLLVDNGVDITRLPLGTRKQRLAERLRVPPEGILRVEHVASGAARLYSEAVLGLGLEGLVAKGVDSIYRPGVRSRDWVKIKRPNTVPPDRSRPAKR